MFVFLNVLCYKIPNNALTPQNLQKTENYEIETMLEFERRRAFAVSFHSKKFVGSIPGVRPFCAESACSHYMCVGSPRVPLTVQKHEPEANWEL